MLSSTDISDAAAGFLPGRRLIIEVCFIAVKYLVKW